MESVRPDIQSETCGESAFVAVERGNYTPDGLATALTTQMQRPIVFEPTNGNCGGNNRLVVQLMGQVETLYIPQGMYDPQNLINCICSLMSEKLNLLMDVGEDDYWCPTFEGNYNMQTGTFTIASTKGQIFGLLFSQSTIGPLLGFESIDYTGNCFYSNATAIYFPITNRRFTDQIYKVVAQANDSTYRFIKTGAFQAPIVSIETVEEDSVRVYTWTKETGGCAHGFQSGDIMTIEGPVNGSVKTVPPFQGMHVVMQVYDAFSFRLGLKRVPETGKPKMIVEDNYVASHWYVTLLDHWS